MNQTVKDLLMCLLAAMVVWLVSCRPLRAREMTEDDFVNEITRPLLAECDGIELPPPAEVRKAAWPHDSEVVKGEISSPRLMQGNGLELSQFQRQVNADREQRATQAREMVDVNVQPAAPRLPPVRPASAPDVSRAGAAGSIRFMVEHMIIPTDEEIQRLNNDDRPDPDYQTKLRALKNAKRVAAGLDPIHPKPS